MCSRNLCGTLVFIAAHILVCILPFVASFTFILVLRLTGASFDTGSQQMISHLACGTNMYAFSFPPNTDAKTDAHINTQTHKRRHLTASVLIQFIYVTQPDWLRERERRYLSNASIALAIQRAAINQSACIILLADILHSEQANS